ncbi:MAG TPA: hypothetical protein VFW44_13965 [Bryobacteraceae bacterium]|nr:hypothetical protein [Bryobacteraceae bacterium]
MKYFLLIPALVVCGWMPCGWAQQTPANPPPDQKHHRGAAKEIGSGAGDIGKGTAKGAGSAAKGAGKGAVDLVTLHPIDAAASVGKGAAAAGTNVGVGAAKGTGKIGKGIGKAIRKIF